MCPARVTHRHETEGRRVIPIFLGAQDLNNTFLQDSSCVAYHSAAIQGSADNTEKGYLYHSASQFFTPPDQNVFIFHFFQRLLKPSIFQKRSKTVPQHQVPLGVKMNDVTNGYFFQ